MTSGSETIETIWVPNWDCYVEIKSNAGLNRVGQVQNGSKSVCFLSSKVEKVKVWETRCWVLILKDGFFCGDARLGPSQR